MKRFHLTDLQAEAILDTKLRHLAKLEEMKIKGEQNDLTKERDDLQQTLESPRKLKSLIRQEIIADAKKYGDDRSSPLVERAEAQALREDEVLPTEPLTVILSTMGWVRAAKGHEIDGKSLSYKAGDEFKMQAGGRSNQQAVFIDSTGRTYSALAHTLPSARGQGEPLTGRFNPPPGATFEGVLFNEPDSLYALGSDAGYGFIVTLSELYSKNRSGKAVLKLPTHSKVLLPLYIPTIENHSVALVTNTGYLLVFPLAELPILPRGKGNKMMGISSAKASKRDEFISSWTILKNNQGLILHAGRRTLKLKPNEISHYQSERGRRGAKLPRSFQQIDHIESD